MKRAGSVLARLRTGGLQGHVGTIRGADVAQQRRFLDLPRAGEQQNRELLRCPDDVRLERACDVHVDSVMVCRL